MRRKISVRFHNGSVLKSEPQEFSDEDVELLMARLRDGLSEPKEAVSFRTTTGHVVIPGDDIKFIEIVDEDSSGSTD